MKLSNSEISAWGKLSCQYILAFTNGKILTVVRMVQIHCRFLATQGFAIALREIQISTVY